MYRYGPDYNWRSTTRYGGEYRQWGSPSRYGGEYGFSGPRTGRFYDRDFSGYESQPFPRDRYDRGFVDRGGRYATDRWGRGPYREDEGGFDWRDEMREMGGRPYPSPWNVSHPGQTHHYGLGFGQGRGQFIYK